MLWAGHGGVIRAAFIGSLALAISGSLAWGQTKPAKAGGIPPPVLAALKAAGAKVLRDPYSAQWERLTYAVRPNVRGEPTEVVCGYVNGKNAFGAYEGAEGFVYLVHANMLILASEPLTGRTILKTFCTGLI